MTDKPDNELQMFESRLNALPMYGSDRSVARTALRNGFVLIERAAWAWQKIHDLPAVFASRPRLAIKP